MTTRIHYFCRRHWKYLKHGRAMVRKNREATCCFCAANASYRARTTERAVCPPGHLAPGVLKAIAGRAFNAALADNPLPFGAEAELEVTDPK
jgi:hypothetical protein